MTGGNGKTSLDRIVRSDWARGERDGLSIGPIAANDGDMAFSQDARMTHELVSLFLSIEDQDARARCLAFVREQAEGGLE
ncbi:hypothetical protein [Methylobacterium brachythecii]|uniref:Uncharacterized protein n=1 Tax=Methylobacterium brachythecii TaxID=1176177 RepID=A0A7W6AHM3_9HYPH|nr:hypothetical protein [Methylobacterium brachythecii]MBB3901620.1 hypothetical protein [Methylobacterium brachythecii]GLS44022.1 hypothetical protein GCM10007884_20080 [Methylobacterium brachythecii]